MAADNLLALSQIHSSFASVSPAASGLQEPARPSDPHMRSLHQPIALAAVAMPIGAVQADSMPDRLISIRDVCELFGLGRTAAYELTHRPSFPEPIVISARCYRWWASEV